MLCLPQEVKTLVRWVMTLYAFFSQIATDNPVLIAYGPLGVICGWFMVRFEKIFGELRGLNHKIEGLTRAMLVDLLERESVGRKAKDYAREAIAKIDAQQNDRSGK